MTWFKVDDGLHKHRKRVRVGVSVEGFAAMGLWTVAGSWCSDELTDGWVPDDVVEYLAPVVGQDLAKRLEKAGLWERVSRDGEDGWQFHDWTEQNPTKNQVLAERVAAARRQALVRNPELREFVRERDQNRCRYCGTEVRWNDRRGPLGGTFDHVDPHGQNVADNLVVACRGCNSSKGPRTPAQAGMQVIPLNRIQTVSRYGLKTDLDSSTSPTRPDPTRPEVQEQEQKATSQIDAAPEDEDDLDDEPDTDPKNDREDINLVCQHLADRIVGNGSKRPTIGKRWRNAARLMIDRDRRTVEQILKAIDWCQDDEFWRGNVLSMPKLRKQYDTLRLAAQRRRNANGGGPPINSGANKHNDSQDRRPTITGVIASQALAEDLAGGAK